MSNNFLLNLNASSWWSLLHVSNTAKLGVFHVFEINVCSLKNVTKYGRVFFLQRVWNRSSEPASTFFWAMSSHNNEMNLVACTGCCVGTCTVWVATPMQFMILGHGQKSSLVWNKKGLRNCLYICVCVCVCLYMEIMLTINKIFF